MKTCTVTRKRAIFVLLVLLGASAVTWGVLGRRAEPSGLTDVDLEALSRLLASGKPGILEFYTTSCPYCKMMVPVLERIQREYGDRLFVVTMNAEKHPSEAGKYAIMGVPTVIVFDASGRTVGRLVGYRGYEEVLGALREYGLVR